MDPRAVLADYLRDGSGIAIMEQSALSTLDSSMANAEHSCNVDSAMLLVQAINLPH